MRVVFTPRAGKQLDHLYDYIATQSGEARANGYVARILLFCDRLSTFPHRGTTRDDLLPGLRIIGFERRIAVAFTVTDELVLIEGIFYGGQNLPRAWVGD